MEHCDVKPEVRRAMESGGKSGAKENGGERKAMEHWAEMSGFWDVTTFGSEMVMCSTCSSFVWRKKRELFPDPSKEVVEVVMEAEKMRNLSEAFLRYGPFQEMEPAEATEKQWQVLRRRRRIMMETMRCPACSRSLLCSIWSRSGAGPGEEDKAAGSKEKESSSEEGSELMAVANSRSVKKSKRSRVEGNGSSSGLKKKKKKKKAKNEDKEGSGSKKKANISSEMEGSGLKVGETEEGSGSKLAKMEVRESACVTGKKTKMVTKRFDRMSIDILVRTGPRKPYTCDTINTLLKCMFDSDIREYEVDREFKKYLRRQSSIRGYAEYQMEVTDDEDE